MWFRFLLQINIVNQIFNQFPRKAFFSLILLKTNQKTRIEKVNWAKSFITIKTIILCYFGLRRLKAWAYSKNGHRLGCKVFV
jgi:hypothetical protein